MLFVTNRRIEGSRRSEAGRTICFAPGDPGAWRLPLFLSAARPRPVCRADRHPVLLDGCGGRRGGRSCSSSMASAASPRSAVFPDALQLQTLCDALEPGLVEVVAVVWPCDDDFGLVARLLGRPALGHGQRVRARSDARQVRGLARSPRHRGDLPQACQRRGALDGQPRARHRPGELGARLRCRAGSVPQPVPGRGGRCQRPVRARTAGCGPERGRAAMSSSITRRTTSRYGPARSSTSRTGSSAAGSATPARSASRRRRPTSSPSTVTISTTPTTRLAIPTCSPGPTAPQVPLSGMWSRPCARAALPVRRLKDGSWSWVQAPGWRPLPRTAIFLRKLQPHCPPDREH